MKRIIICLLVISTSCCLKESFKSRDVVIMSWNVQNLFDGVDNGNEYDDFSVKDGLWSDKLYNIRLKNISKVIEFHKPDIIAFQEIEGEVVLADLQIKLPQYIYYAATDLPGAIQLGFLSKYPIIKTGLIMVSADDTRLRSLFEIRLNIEGKEIVVINNHWKSKYGDFSEYLRIKSSIALKKRLGELGNIEVVVLGDLNENYNEYQRVNRSYDTALMYNQKGMGLFITDNIPLNSELFTVWPDTDWPGSYRYKGEWETIDHFLLNDKLLDSVGFYYSSFFVDHRTELLTVNGDVKKWNSDFRTGYSDHLPMLLTLKRDGIETTLE